MRRKPVKITLCDDASSSRSFQFRPNELQHRGDERVVQQRTHLYQSQRRTVLLLVGKEFKLQFVKVVMGQDCACPHENDCNRNTKPLRNLSSAVSWSRAERLIHVVSKFNNHTKRIKF